MQNSLTVSVIDGSVTELRELLLAAAGWFGIETHQPGDPGHYDFYSQMLMRGADEIGRLSALSVEELSREQDALIEARLRQIEEAAEEQALVNGRLDRMLGQLAAWSPPSPEHESMKETVKAYLEKGKIDHLPPPLERLSPQAWRAERIAASKRSIELAKECLENLRRDAEEATLWLKQLRESL